MLRGDPIALDPELGREPLAVVGARALAAWPMWAGALVLGLPSMHDLVVLVPCASAATLVALSVAHIIGESGTPVPVSRAWRLVGYGLMADFAIACAQLLMTGAIRPRAGASPVIDLVIALGIYGVASRMLAPEHLAPPYRKRVAVDAAAPVILAALAALGALHGATDPIAMPFVVAPLVALRCASYADLRIPRGLSRQVGSAAWLTTVAVLMLVTSALGASRTPLASASGLSQAMLLACISAVIASVMVLVRARQLHGALWGVVREYRPDGLVLAVRGGEDRVHIVPSQPVPGAGMPPLDHTVTFLEVEELGSDGAPYRSGPPFIRARLAIGGSSSLLSGALVARAALWAAWSSAALAAAFALG